ncbi:class I SAM-dependent methyltransferase [Sinorhizobium medicae]|uniref:class I SAM-dependent methyltransferase n=1 Tax=Sinorhizobium medicae TaxID=110321 RepID=UPI000FD75837|nr:class I SAM-dependent methyltransferase [Sinorhizobium medicae]RVP47823.1 class I SAM-dependent methyltransferase [Sinorhizobium medicae]RVP74601.1 class I SAM-dependent methyltransferase [Sinorhizobium medicae]UWU12619.1 class I SAM-dependent methyltransferase [Sinorhizobium medicae]
MLERVAPTTAAAMADHWNLRAWKFDASASHRRDAQAWQAVFEAALGRAPLDLVDLGCGTGACALLAGSLGHRVTAVDGSAEMLSHARAAATEADLSMNFIHATMDEAALPAASADVVTLRNVLWTLEKPSAALALARKILRPDGKLLVSDGLWFRHRANDSRDIFGAHLPFYNGLTEANARHLLDSTGFGGIESWRHLMPGHPYGVVYDDPETPIAFFILTAISPE